MSGKTAKKVRKTIRGMGITKEAIDARVERTVHERVEKRVEQEFEARVAKTEAVLKQLAGAKARAELVRPRPRRCPAWLWKRLVKLVVNT